MNEATHRSTETLKKEPTSEQGMSVAKITIDEVRALLRQSRSSLEPDAILKKAGEAIARTRMALDKPSKEDELIISDALMAVSHERHYLIAESVVDERWRPMVMDLANCIQKEYHCTASSEVALAGLAAAAYYRSLRASRKINALIEKESIGMTGVQLIAQVSKEADRAYRQYLAAIETLRGRKQPQMRVSIQAKSAFFAENQTINAGGSQNYEENNDRQ